MSPETPVILMTAFEHPGDRHRAIEGGATDFLIKPVVGSACARRSGARSTRQTRPSRASTSRIRSSVPSAPLGP
jgi:CheY-like chemotaxis protein